MNVIGKWKELFLLLLVATGLTIGAQAQQRDRFTPTTNQLGAYLAVTGNGFTSGVFKSIDLSRRFSLNYGVAYSQYYNSGFGNAEWNDGRNYHYSLSIPVEFRYYILPKENRLTAFLFSSVGPALYDIKHVRPSVKLGGAVQYRINDQSYIQFRVMAYQARQFPGMTAGGYPSFN